MKDGKILLSESNKNRDAFKVEGTCMITSAPFPDSSTRPTCNQPRENHFGIRDQNSV